MELILIGQIEIKSFKGKRHKTKTVIINLFALKTQICTVENKEIIKIFHGS